MMKYLCFYSSKQTREHIFEKLRPQRVRAAAHPRSVIMMSWLRTAFFGVGWSSDTQDFRKPADALRRQRPRARPEGPVPPSERGDPSVAAERARLRAEDLEISLRHHNGNIRAERALAHFIQEINELVKKENRAVRLKERMYDSVEMRNEFSRAVADAYGFVVEVHKAQSEYVVAAELMETAASDRQPDIRSMKERYEKEMALLRIVVAKIEALARADEIRL